MGINQFLHPARDVYVKSHLEYWNFDLQRWSFGQGGFWTLHLDTMLVSVVLAVLLLILLALVVDNFRAKNPGKLQVCVELLFESIDNLVKDVVGERDDFITAVALASFSWIFLMNACDFLPVDLLPRLFLHDFRAVPTDDPNCTFGLSITIFLLCNYYLVRFKRGSGVLREFFLEPFGVWLAPFNLVFKLIEQLVKPLSLSLRLYGNMFAGELIFLLIAMLPWWAQWPVGGAWAVFHVLVILIQAFVFMMLSVIYLSMARQLSE